MNWTIFLPLLFFGLLPEAWSAAPGRSKLRASTGLYFYRPSFRSFDVQSSLRDRVRAVPAISVEGGLDTDSAAELSIWYLQKDYLLQSAASYRWQSAPRVFVSVGYRYWLFSRVSLFMGLASHYLAGAAQDLLLSGSESQALSGKSSKAADYAADMSLAFCLYQGKQGDFLIDYRTAISLFPSRGEQSDHSAVFIKYRWAVK